MRAAEIAARLAQSAETVAAHLLAGGHRDGAEWRAGSVAGDAGQSLGVRLTGAKSGMWKDFATNEGGDLLDLWAAHYDLTVAAAMREASSWLGVTPLRVERIRDHSPVALKIPTGAMAVTDGDVLRWLTETRKLPEASIRAYRLAERNGKLMMPAFAPDGKTLRYAKYRAVPMKEFTSEKGGESCLFGWQAIPREARRVVICEGEMDAVAWHAYGYPALSPTNGAQSLNWIDGEFDALERFDEILIAYDNDTAGQAGAKAVAERLGLERCRLVHLGTKDANDALMAGVSGTEIEAAVKRAKALDPPGLVRVADCRAAVQEFFAGGAHKIGVGLPWRKAEGLFTFGASELTILAGQTGHGKTELATQFTLEAMRQGLRACVASMEFIAERYVSRMARQCAALENPTPAYLDSVLDWLDERMVLFGERGTTKLDRLFAVFAYAARRYGCRWFMVDNLAKCGIAEDDYNGQKNLVDRLGDFANDHRAHVILCAHMRKGDQHRREQDLRDVKGSGGITDMADNVLLLIRNKAKEMAIEEAKRENEFADLGTFDEQRDALMVCDKVRDGNAEPTFALWFDRRSHQFVGAPTHSARRYVEFTQVANGKVQGVDL